MFLQIPSLIEAASEVLQRRLGPATALATWRVADLCSLEKLKTYATTTACFHFSSLSQRQEWLGAPFAVVRALLSDDRLRLRSEDEAYNAAIAWLRAREPPADANMAKNLLALVRYSALLTVPAPAKVAKVAPRRGFAACLYALGGKDGKPNGWNPSSCVERYDPVTDLWVTVEPMGTARFGCFGAVLDGKIYVAGGIRAKSDSEGEVDSAWASLALVECYDLRSV